MIHNFRWIAAIFTFEIKKTGPILTQLYSKILYRNKKAPPIGEALRYPTKLYFVNLVS
jgi:hypothetical protein